MELLLFFVQLCILLININETKISRNNGMNEILTFLDIEWDFLRLAIIFLSFTARLRAPRRRNVHLMLSPNLSNQLRRRRDCIGGPDGRVRPLPDDAARVRELCSVPKIRRSRHDVPVCRITEAGPCEGFFGVLMLKVQTGRESGKRSYNSIHESGGNHHMTLKQSSKLNFTITRSISDHTIFI